GALRRRRTDARFRARLRAARPAGLQVRCRRLSEGSPGSGPLPMSIEPPIGGVAVIDTASTPQPPLWPSVGALVVSGWVRGIVSLAVGYQLLERLAQPIPTLARSGLVAPRRLEQPEPGAPYTASGGWDHLLATIRIVVAQTGATLEQAEPVDVPAAVAEALPG